MVGHIARISFSSCRITTNWHLMVQPMAVIIVALATCLYLDVWLQIFPGQGMRYALIDVVDCLLEYSGSHILLFLVLIQNFQQHLVDSGKEINPLSVTFTPKTKVQLSLTEELRFAFCSHLLCRNCILFQEKVSKLCILFGCVTRASISANRK